MSVCFNTAAGLIPKEKPRYLDRSCARSSGANKSMTTTQRVKLRIVCDFVFIFLSPTHSHVPVIKAGRCCVSVSPLGLEEIFQRESLAESTRPTPCWICLKWAVILVYGMKRNHFETT